MRFLSAILFLLPAVLVVNFSAQAQQKYVAVTIDDLPTVTDFDGDRAEREITRKIVGQIKGAGIPAIGFVNEKGLFPDGKLDASEENLLRRWLVAKIELGNHTYSHADLDAVGLDAYEKAVLKGEIVTKKLLREYGGRMIYFRHPYLKTGKDLPTKTGLENFLAQHHYTVAPVTIAVSDWVFAHAYDKALLNKNPQLAKKISAAYVPFVLQEFAYSENLAAKLFGRDIRQILLIHANDINAENIGAMIRALRKQGYQFVSLAEALRDPAYASPDSYVGESGMGWLQRWAITRGTNDLLVGEPTLPQFVKDAAGPEMY